MTKILNFALKIKGGGREGGTCEVLLPCHPLKFETCTSLNPIHAGGHCAPYRFFSLLCQNGFWWIDETF